MRFELSMCRRSVYSRSGGCQPLPLFVCAGLDQHAASLAEVLHRPAGPLSTEVATNCVDFRQSSDKPSYVPACRLSQARRCLISTCNSEHALGLPTVSCERTWEGRTVGGLVLLVMAWMIPWPPVIFGSFLVVRCRAQYCMQNV